MAAAGGKVRESNYHSPLRARQAAATRRSIVEAALALFQERGWATTTLPMIAEHAGVSVDTIYATFGTKSDLFMAAIDLAIVGDDGEAPMADRPDFAELGRGRRAERLRAGVRYTMDVYDRSVPILRTLREAAASDEQAQARDARYDQDRHNLIAAGMTLILGAEPPSQLVDAIWAVISPEVYTHLRDGRGWSRQQVEDWFVDLAAAAIRRARAHPPRS
jgi:AcrR family transcriptional regulator